MAVLSQYLLFFYFLYSQFFFGGGGGVGGDFELFIDFVFDLLCDLLLYFHLMSFLLILKWLETFFQ